MTGPSSRGAPGVRTRGKPHFARGCITVCECAPAPYFSARQEQCGKHLVFALHFIQGAAAMTNIFYIIGAIVVVLAVLAFFGLR